MRSAIIPAHNECSTVADVVNAVRKSVDEVIVVDSCSDDNTAVYAKKAGARVVYAKVSGKHHALKAGIKASRGDDLVFVDADLIDPPTDIAERLLTPLVNGISLVKGYYIRCEENDKFFAGRLTEICARPLLTMYMPELAHIREPLAGEFALRRDLAVFMPFAPGFAVDLGFLINSAKFGKIAEVNLGIKVHKHRSVFDLGIASIQVATTILGGVHSQQDVATITQYPNGVGKKLQVDLKVLNHVYHDGVK